MLEVGAGTGRNLAYYPLAQCTHITVTDASSAMLHVAHNKLHDKGILPWIFVLQVMLTKL